jgi:hypothetical protein
LFTLLGYCCIQYSNLVKNEVNLIFNEIRILYTTVFRRIYGPKYEGGEWKIRTNGELEELNKGENIVKLIKGQRICWLGHLERMEEGRMPKKMFTQELEGTRRRGRPRKGWREEVERDLQVMGVRRWRELVIDRENGEVLFDRPKSTAGCSANGRRRRISIKQYPTNVNNLDPNRTPKSDKDLFLY